MAEEEVGLRARLKDRDEVVRGLQGIERGVGGITKKAAFIGGAFAAAGAVTTKALFGIGQTFDTVNKTIVVGTGASGAQLDALNLSVKNIARNTPSTLTDIGTAVADVNTRLGLTGKPLEDMSRRLLNLSRITGTDLSSNIANVSRVFGDWSIKSEDQAGALDAVFEATKRTGIGLDKLTQMTVQYGAPLRQFGFGFEESLALFGKWEQEGVNTQVVLAGLKAGLGKFSKEGKEPVKALNDIEAAIKAAGSTGEANRIAIEAFGQRAGPDMAAAVREGRFELGELTKGLKNSKGALEDADKRTRSFGEQWQILKNKALVKLEPIATRVFGAISEGAAVLNKDVVPMVTQFVHQMKNGRGPGGQFAEVLRDVAGFLGALFGFVRDNKATVGTFVGVLLTAAAAVKVLAIATGILNAVMAINPITIVVLALAALAAGLVYAWKNSETFRTIVTGAFDAVKTAAVFVWDWLKKNWPLLLAILTGPFGVAVYLIVKHWDTIKSGAGAAKDWVVDKFDALVGFFKRMPGRMADAAVGLFDGIKDAFRGAINFVIDAWNGLSFSLPSVDTHIPGVGRVGGFTIGTPNIPRLAEGGIVSAQPGGIIANIGEGRWDEAVVPLNGARYLIDGSGVTRLPMPALPDPQDIDIPDLPDGQTLRQPLHIHLDVDGREIGEAVLNDLRDRGARL